MLQSKCLSLCTCLTRLWLPLLLQFLVPYKSEAQKNRFAENDVEVRSPILIKDTVDVSAFYFASIDLIDTAEIIEVPLIELNPNGKQFVSEYLKTNNADLVKIKKRSASYFKTIESHFRKNNLPVELKYLAVIESKLKTSAMSDVGAAGLWQLMPQTARYLGLKVTAKYDERKQMVKSTAAAAKYIKQLYTQFDDWLLVIAAYNSGAAPVYRAIKKAGSRDFWTLQQFLPAETRAHVKRFIGAHYFFENEGSATTLTKAETIKHFKAVADHIESMKVIQEIIQPQTTTEEAMSKTDAQNL